MRIHTYTAGTRAALTHPDVPPETPLRELITIEVGDAVYRAGDEGEIDIELTVIEIFGADSGRVISHHCREVAITVSYTGTEVHLTVHPAADVERVRAKAVAELKLTPAIAADMVLRLPGSTEDLPATSPIGAYVAKGTCALALDLVHVVRPQG